MLNAPFFFFENLWQRTKSTKNFLEAPRFCSNFLLPDPRRALDALKVSGFSQNEPPRREWGWRAGWAGWAPTPGRALDAPKVFGFSRKELLDAPLDAPSSNAERSLGPDFWTRVQEQRASDRTRVRLHLCSRVLRNTHIFRSRGPHNNHATLFCYHPPDNHSKFNSLRIKAATVTVL